MFTDPSLVAMQMDIWWIFTGGDDPVKYINKYPGRFELCHIKTKEILQHDPSVEKLDYRKILSHRAKVGFSEYILENEPGIQEPMDFIANSFHFMETLF